MRRRRRPANELRTAIDCLPVETRRAMLDGMGGNRIIVGAYVDREGGVCPMLAAHRNGGRTSLASFARAWDRYTKAGKGPRPASERELRTLTAMLEASIAMDEAGTADDLSEAIAAHRFALRRRPAAPPPMPAPVPRKPRRETGERDRSSELRHTHGWAWLRPFRRYDAYELALRQIEASERATAEAASQPQREQPQRERELV